MQLKGDKNIFSQTLTKWKSTKTNLDSSYNKGLNKNQMITRSIQGTNTIFNQNTHKLQKVTKCFKQKE